MADTVVLFLIFGTLWQMIWIWKGLRVMKTIWRAHQGPVFDIAIDGFTAITGGEDMKLCLWNFAKDYRLVPPGEFTRGEMLVKEIEVRTARSLRFQFPPHMLAALFTHECSCTDSRNCVG